MPNTYTIVLKNYNTHNLGSTRVKQGKGVRHKTISAQIKY